MNPPSRIRRLRSSLLLVLEAMPKVRRRGFKGLVGSMTVVALMLAIVAPAAAARPRLVLRWDGKKDVHVGEAINVDWSQETDTEVEEATFTIQEARPGGGWRTVLGRLKGYGPEFGEATLPAHKVLGTYRYRLAMILKGKVIAQKRVTIRVFDRVPLSALLAGHGSFGGGGVYSFAGGRFTYMASVPIAATGEQTLFTVAPNDCSAIHLEFLIGGSEATVKVKDQQRSPYRESEIAKGDTVEGFENIYAADRPWSLIAEPRGESGFPSSLYLFGWANCDSREPF